MPPWDASPNNGTIDYTCFVTPTGFTEDRWIQSAEVRPANRFVVPQVIVNVREPGNRYMRNAVPGVPCVPKDRGGGAGEYLVGFTPGKPAPAAANGTFAISAGPAHLVAMWPHMHVRGKSMRFELVDKSGRRHTLLDVPNWQMRYIPEEPLRLGAGSVIEVFAVSDNSPNSKHNPDPTKFFAGAPRVGIGFTTLGRDQSHNPRAAAE